MINYETINETLVYVVAILSVILGCVVVLYMVKTDDLYDQNTRAINENLEIFGKIIDKLDLRLWNFQFDIDDLDSNIKACLNPTFTAKDILGAQTAYLLNQGDNITVVTCTSGNCRAT